MCETKKVEQTRKVVQASMGDTEQSTPSYDALLSDLISLSYEDKAATKAATALDFVRDGDVASLRTLLRSDQKKIQINARHPISGRSLLHDACAEGQKDVVKFLLEETEADLMLRTMLGRCSPLHLAVTGDYRPIVFLLLSHGADASCRDRFGSSPMHYVKSLSVAKLLIQYGAKVLDYNAKRKAALESTLAFAHASYELQKYLKAQAEVEYKAKLAVLRQRKKVLKTTVTADSKTKATRRKKLKELTIKPD